MSQSSSEYPKNPHSFLESVSSWPETKCYEEGSIMIPKILEKLCNSCPMLDVVIPTVNILVEKFLASFFKQELGKEILIQICPVLSACFDDALSSLPSEAVEASTLTLLSVVESLKSATRVLQCLENVVRKMAPLISEQTKIHTLHDVPTLTLDVLKKSYSHCKDSEKTYKTLFKSSSNALSVLFQRTFSLQKSLSVFLSRLKCVPLGGDSMERDSVLAICGTLVDICRIISALDSMLVGSVWKLLLSILLEFEPLISEGIRLSQYLEALSENILDNVRYTIQLATTSSHLLKSGDVATKKAYGHTCRISDFYLTSLLSLISEYKVAFHKDGIVAVCSLMVELFAASKSALQTAQGSFENPLLSMGGGDGILKKMDIIIKELTQAPEFVETYQDFDHKPDSREQSFGILLFHLEMCKEFVFGSDEIRHVEFFHKIALEQVFKSACQARDDLSLSFCGLHRPEEASLYDLVVARCCCLMLSSFSTSLPCVDFVLEQLLGYNSCRSVLASDVLLLISKHSPAARINCCNIFMEFLNTAPSPVCPFVTSWPAQQVSLLLRRMSTLLTEEQRESLVCKPSVTSKAFCDQAGSFVHSCSVVVRMTKLWSEGKATVKELDSTLVPSMVCITSYIRENHSGSIIEKAKRDLYLASRALEDLWLCISSLNDLLYNSLFFKRTLVALIDLTVTFNDSGTDVDVLKVLSALASIHKNQDHPVLIRCRTAKVLQICQRSDMHQDAENELVQMLSTLLRDPHWLVRHEALCSFEVISRTTSGLAIIEQCRRSPELTAMLEAHLCQTSGGQPAESSFWKCTSAVSLEKIKGLYASWCSQQERTCSALKAVDLKLKHGPEMKLADALRKTIDEVQRFVSESEPASTSLFMKSVTESYKMLETVLSDV